MKKRLITVAAACLCAAGMITGNSVTTFASGVSGSLPAAGVGLAIEEGSSMADAQREQGQDVLENTASSGDIAQDASQRDGASSEAEGEKEQVSGSDVPAGALSGNSASELGSMGGSLSSDLLSYDSVSSNESGDQKNTVSQNASLFEEISVSMNEPEEEKEPVQVVDIVTIRPEDIDILKDNEEDFRNLVIAQVNDYVNVRSLPSEEGEVVGKLYDNAAGSFLGEENGWYRIQSGNVEGYVKAEYCVTGNEAQTLAKQVGTRIATVTTTTLKVRNEPSTEASVLGLCPIEDQLVVSEELDGWVKVNVEEGDGYVSMDYVTLSTEFAKAESKAEEEARLAKEAAAREAANQAARQRQRESVAEDESGAQGAQEAVPVPAVSGSGQGASVAQYALQFVGNPYVYGGVSLTNGADCSGFVKSVYDHFGVSLPHSSSGDRSMGYAVGSLAEAQPGDILCYSGHVALYIGNGQIVHASTPATGIKVSEANYRKILAIRRIF